MPARTEPSSARKAASEEERLSHRERKTALIQLKFGRAAHLLSMIAAVLLALAAIIALVSTWIYSGTPPEPLNSMKWLIPLFAGTIMAFAVIYLKWEPFLTDRTEKHFLTSVAAAVVPMFMIVLIVLNAIGYVNFGAGTWIYPISFVGISLSLVSIAMIWDGMSRRKSISIASALIPLLIMTLPMLFTGSTESDILTLLPLIFLGSAVCFQLSGSMMHVISTSTSVQEREIIRASDSKLFKIKEELERKQREIEFKEKALVGREVGFETFEKALNDQKLDLDQREKLTEKLEGDVKTKDAKLRGELEKFSAKELSVGTREEKLAQKKMELDSQESEMEVKALGLQSKEGKLSEEKDRLQQEWTNLKVMEKQQQQRQEQIQLELASLKSNKESLERDQRKLSEKEKELQLRESSLEMRLRSAESTKAVSGEGVDKLKQWEAQLLKKDEMMVTWQSQLADRQRGLEERIKEYEMKLKNVNERILSVEGKEKDLLEKEAGVSRYDKDVSAQREEVAQIFIQLDALKQETERRKANYETMLIELQRRNQELAKNEELVKSQTVAIESKDSASKATLERLDREKAEMESRRRELIELDKGLSAKVSQLQIREMQLSERQAQVEMMLQDGRIDSGETSEMLGQIKERERALELREKGILEKEKDLRTRFYSSGKGEDIPTIGTEGAAPKIEKISTGTKRMDDLLYGGVPTGSSILFVGPPFSGKEVAILSFLADGAKRGIPSIVITTSKTPSELARDFAPILPSLLEMERLGLIRWIDATPGEAAKDVPGRAKYYAKVDGADDFPAIIEAIDRFTADLKGTHPCFRIGYLSLSTSISHTDETESTKFIQAMVRMTRDSDSAAMFALEKGMHSEQQIESIQHLLDGAILIKLDKQKTYLSVIGLGEAQTRDWIEFKFTSTGLIIGAFSLERIR